MIAPAAAALLAETRRRPGRLLLTGLAILVATTFAAGTLLFSETLREYIAAANQQTPAGASVVVATDELPTTDTGRADEAVVTDLLGRIATVDGVGDVTPVTSAYLRIPEQGGGIWVLVADPMAGPLSRLAGPPTQGRVPATADEVAVSSATAARTGIAPGTTLTLVPEDAPVRPVTVTGVLPSARGEINATLFAAPGTVTGLGGWISQIDVAAAPGVATPDATVLTTRIGAAVGDPDTVRAGAVVRAEEAAAGSDSVDAVLVGIGVFAGLALVAAAVVVASTFRIVLTQRRGQLALLRCVGARRGQVIGAVLAEALVSGLVAGVLGIAVAVGCGYGLLAGLSLAGVRDVPELVLWWPGLAAVLLVAVLTTVLAAVSPATAAARVPPVAALSSAASGESGTPRTGRRVVSGALLGAGAAGLALLGFALAGSAAAALIVMAASGMTAFAALVVLGPLLVRVLAATVGRGIAALGAAPGRLATANAGQVPRRTAATISVLTLGVGLTSALLVALASTQADAEASIAAMFPSEIVVAGEGSDLAALATELADDQRVVARADGTSLFVDPAPGRSADELRAAVGQAVTGDSEVYVQYASEARADLQSTVDTSRLIGLGLVGMTALVAVVGVGVTLMLSVTERTRETGLLRAVGLTRRGVRAMVAWEAALSGVGAAVVGAGIGALYGVFAVTVLGVGVGFAPVALPSLGALVVGVVAVAVLAATIPAVRAGRVPPIRALQDA